MEPLKSNLAAPARVGGAYGPHSARPQAPDASGAFGQLLAAQLSKQGNVSLSGHAQVRFEQRDLALDGAAVQRLSSALDKAHVKGIRTSVIMLDGMAMVANVADRRIVTALNAVQAKDKVFTNVDGVVIA
jgi:flagellar operon protein